MYYLIKYTGVKPIGDGVCYFGHTQSILVIKWLSQHIHDIEVTEYETLENMWNDMKEQGLADEINYMYPMEYEINYSEDKQFGYPPTVIDDEYVDEVAVDYFISDIEEICTKSWRIRDYMKDGDMKKFICSIIQVLSDMNDAISHHRLRDDDINYDTRVVIARWICNDEGYSYYLGEY